MIHFPSTLMYLTLYVDFVQEPAFQRLVFVTMLAWEHPYTNKYESHGEKASFQVHFSVRNAPFVLH